jgi:hypothetical protein
MVDLEQANKPQRLVAYFRGSFRISIYWIDFAGPFPVHGSRATDGALRGFSMSWWIWRRHPDRKGWSLFSMDITGCLILGMLLLLMFFIMMELPAALSRAKLLQ